jgi:endonuclease-3
VNKTPHPIREICRRLRKVYGPVKLARPLPPLDELVATILSQNTSDRNSDAAFEELRRRFPTWDAVRRAAVGRIARAIHKGGLARQKAPRIKAVLQNIYAEHGELSLDFLHAMPTAKALEYLRKFAGVGPKTAACVLLFACRKPVLPVDTHIHRVSRRLGLIGPKTTAEKAHDEMARLVPRRMVLDFHVQVIRHGRSVCTARAPHCTECVLLELCSEGKRRLGMKQLGRH